MGTITVTGEYGTAAEGVVRQLADTIGYETIGEDLQRQIAEQLNLTESEVEVFRKASQSRLIRMMDRYTCSLVQKVEPQPSSIEDGLITWEVRGVEQGEEESFRFELIGLGKGEFEECVLYQKGLNEKYVFGAEVPPEKEESDNITLVRKGKAAAGE